MKSLSIAKKKSLKPSPNLRRPSLPPLKQVGEGTTKGGIKNDAMQQHHSSLALCDLKKI
jgi:hypothetical protein